MGTPDFAVGVLRSLVENGCDVVGVVTVPDKPAGRGRQLKMSAVKEFIVNYNDSLVADSANFENESASREPIKLLQPEKLRSEEFLAKLTDLNADLFIVVAFRMLPEIVWAMPRLGTFNLHASLLPNYRGAAPINWAIMNGEVKTGVTTFMLNHEIDCGAVLFREECAIEPHDNFESLYIKLMKIGEQLVLKTVSAISAGEVTPIAQDIFEAVKAAPKLFKETMELTFDERTTVEMVHNKVRGLSPYPAAWVKIDAEGKSPIVSKIFTTHIEKDDALQCDIGVWQTDSKTYLRVSALGGWLYIDELQPQNKKRMLVVDFLRGWR